MCEEDPIIPIISLHTMTEELQEFVSFPLWEEVDIVDRNTYIGISGHIVSVHIRYTFDVYMTFYI